MPTQGTLTLHIRDKAVGSGTIRTQPGKFGLGGGGLVFGRSGAEPVTDDYPGERPWAFTGGTHQAGRDRRERRSVRRPGEGGGGGVRPAVGQQRASLGSTRRVSDMPEAFEHGVR